MPRINRGLVENGIYHVISRGNDGQTVFFKLADYQAFLKLMWESKIKFPIKILGFCFMSNHVHFVVQNPEGNLLSQWMHWLMSSHVQRYRRHYGGSGHVWQGRFKSFLVQQDDYLLTVLRYVEANPKRAGLVLSAREWLWSSHASRVQNACGALKTDELPILLPDNWSEFVDRPLQDEEIARIRHSVNKQIPYGTDSWVLKACEKLGLQSILRSRGRPKKGDRLNIL